MSDNQNDDDADNFQASGEVVTTNNASRLANANANAGGTSTGTGAPQQQYVPVPYAGGIATTGLTDSAQQRSSTMGPAEGAGEAKFMPMAAPPQQKHHLQYALVNTNRRKAPAVTTSRDRKMSDQQKSERR